MFTNNKSVKLEGSHGTSESRYELIRKYGFNVNTEGYGGSGAYFWAKCDLYIDYAKAWYYFYSRSGKYRDDQKPEGVVIVVTVSIEKTQRLDLDEQTMINAIHRIATKKSIDLQNKRQIAQVHDILVRNIEKQMNKPIAVVQKRISLPKKCKIKGYSQRLLGLPICYIVRIKDIITIDRTLKVEENG
jgi:hypothetical protein